MMMPEATLPVVVGVDGSVGALGAVRWAAALADKLGAPLHLVCAMPYIGQTLTDVAAAIRAAVIAEHPESAKIILKTAEEVVHAANPAVSVVTQSVALFADEALAAASQDARLIVVGCDDVTPAGALFIGSTTLAAIQLAKCPVVAWRGQITLPTDQPVVVGVDGSASESVALKTGFGLADRLDAPVRLIHAWSRRRPIGDVMLPSMIDWNALEAEEWKHLNMIVAPWRLRYPHVSVNLLSERAEPGRLLLAHSGDAQLVVVGSRHRRTLTRTIFWSTPLKLLHHSSVPVVVCPVVEAANGQDDE